LNKAARNEQKKLSATFLNGIAVALFAIGVFGPVFSVAQSGGVGLVTTILAPGCGLVGYALHLLGRRVLEGIEE
jgi:hypothetical protein